MSRIFVLEDDHDLRNLYQKALGFRGYEVMVTESAEEAIETLTGIDIVPDIAVLDMAMEGLPGSEVVWFIRSQERFHHIPILVVSCNENFREELADADITFMRKPLDLRELYHVVSNIISARQPAAV